MKIVEYKCNICGDIHGSTHATTMVKAIYFTGNTKFEIKKLPAECDTHICVSCLKQLQTQLADLVL